MSSRAALIIQKQLHLYEQSKQDYRVYGYEFFII